MLLADGVTKEGGTIILISACFDGPEPKLYDTLSQKPDPETVIDWIAAGKTEPTGGPMSHGLRRLQAPRP